MTKLLIIDTETTGVSNPQLVEAAYIIINVDLRDFKSNFDILNFTVTNYDSFCERYKPDIAIHPQASRIHGIYADDLIDCPSHKEFKLPECDYLIGHNINFDHRVLDRPDIKLICTLKLARLLYEKDKYSIEGNDKLLNHKLPTLMQHLYPVTYKDVIVNAHNALQDCRMTYYILQRMLTEDFNCNDWQTLHYFAS